jgi:hypothetical protein
MLMSYGILVPGMWKCANRSYTYIFYIKYLIYTRLQIMDFEIVGNLEIDNKYDKGNVVKIYL